MILLMGIAGAGKGTQGKLLAEKYGYQVISTGELLRNYGSDEQHQRMAKGLNLDDQEVTDLLDGVLVKITDQNKVILDGYPRRIVQADWLLGCQANGRLKIDCVINLVASVQAVKSRLTQRGRVDDADGSVAQRIVEYNRDTAPIIDHLRKRNVVVFDVNAVQTVELVHSDIVRLLKDVIV